MRTLVNILGSEWLKVRKSNIWLLVFVSPILSSLLGFFTMKEDGYDYWFMLLSTMVLLHALLFLPLLTGVFGAFVCRYEHSKVTRKLGRI
ncbi:MAG TPA: ABC transporter permease [Paenibacillus sp.]